MNPEQHSPAGGLGQFRTTRWSAVLLSAQSQAPGSQAALAELCRIYWYPIYSFVRRRGASPEDAQDLTQGFFLHLLAHKALSQVSPVKGKFRSFLLASLQNYLSDEADRARCLKRGGNIEFFPLDMRCAEDPRRSCEGCWTCVFLLDASSGGTAHDRRRRLRLERRSPGCAIVFLLTPNRQRCAI